MYIYILYIDLIKNKNIKMTNNKLLIFLSIGKSGNKCHTN